MLCQYSHTNAKSLTRIHAIFAEIQNVSSRGLFFIGTPRIVMKIKFESSNCLSNQVREYRISNLKPKLF